MQLVIMRYVNMTLLMIGAIVILIMPTIDNANNELSKKRNKS